MPGGANHQNDFQAGGSRQNPPKLTINSSNQYELTGLSTQQGLPNQGFEDFAQDFSEDHGLSLLNTQSSHTSPDQFNPQDGHSFQPFRGGNPGKRPALPQTPSSDSLYSPERRFQLAQFDQDFTDPFDGEASISPFEGHSAFDSFITSQSNSQAQSLLSWVEDGYSPASSVYMEDFIDPNGGRVTLEYEDSLALRSAVEHLSMLVKEHSYRLKRSEAVGEQSAIEALREVTLNEHRLGSGFITPRTMDDFAACLNESLSGSLDRSIDADQLCDILGLNAANARVHLSLIVITALPQPGRFRVTIHGPNVTNAVHDRPPRICLFHEPGHDNLPEKWSAIVTPDPTEDFSPPRRRATSLHIPSQGGAPHPGCSLGRTSSASSSSTRSNKRPWTASSQSQSSVLHAQAYDPSRAPAQSSPSSFRSPAPLPDNETGNHQHGMGNTLSRQPSRGRRFRCDVCHKTFEYQKDLRRHSVSHTGVKDFACRTCGKVFSRLDNARRHERQAGH